MVAEFEVTMTGDRELRRNLSKLGRAFGGRAIMPALRTTALIPLNSAKGAVRRVTSNLFRSLHMEDVKGELAVAVGTDVEYARRIEYGFAGIDSLGRTYNQPAQPYLRPAIDENRGAMVREFGEAVEDMVRAAFR